MFSLWFYLESVGRGLALKRIRAVSEHCTYRTNVRGPVTLVYCCRLSLPGEYSATRSPHLANKRCTCSRRRRHSVTITQTRAESFTSSASAARGLRQHISIIVPPPAAAAAASANSKSSKQVCMLTTSVSLRQHIKLLTAPLYVPQM